MHDLDGKIAGVLDGGETKIGLSRRYWICPVRYQVFTASAVTPEDLTPILGEVQTDHHKVVRTKCRKLQE